MNRLLMGAMGISLCLVGTMAMAEEKKHESPPPLLEPSSHALHAPAPMERPIYERVGIKNINIKHITTSPAGIFGDTNDIIRATYGGNERLCVNTGAGPGNTTTWNCVTLGAP